MLGPEQKNPFVEVYDELSAINDLPPNEEGVLIDQPFDVDFDDVTPPTPTKLNESKE